MRKRKQAFCVLLCAALLTACACGRADAPRETETAVLQTEQTTAASTTEAQAEADTAEASESQVETQTQAEETTEADPTTGLNSTDVAEVLSFYQWAAAKNDKPQYTKTLSLVSIDGGEGKVASHVDIFEPIAKKAIAKNSVTGDVLPGRYANIRPSDWQSAEAVSDGTYTTLTVHVVPQTDDAYGKEFEGPVGRSMTVLNGMAAAIDEMPGVSADFGNGQVEVQYQNPTIRVRIDNRTGAFVPGTCTWSYRVHPVLTSLDAKVLAFKVHLQGANGYIDYTMSY